MKNLTLSDFPEKFDPLVVITGDRREDRPKTKGDLLAYSVSNIDMTFILHLGLKNVQILTDKAFVLLTNKEIQDQFANKYILTIGSPAVNFLTRQINNRSLFYFDVHETALQDIKEHEKIIDGIKFSPLDLFLYQEIFERGLTPEEIVSQDLVDYQDKEDLAIRCGQLYDEFTKLNLTDKNWKHFIHNFDRPGIFDPIDGKKHAFATTSHNDFGLISIARNPFSLGEHVIITVAGIHGIATAHGLKLLASKDSFRERPFGGVFEVQFPEFGSWLDKLEKAQIKWQTRPYRQNFSSLDSVFKLVETRTEKIHEDFGIFVSSPYHEEDTYFSNLNFTLKSLCEQYFSGSETAYSIITGGEGIFPKVIENRIRNSTAIIHILNDFKPGVLFEIGLSIGFSKRAYLVWDKRKGQLDYSSLPEAIEKITVLQFDSSINHEFEKIVTEKIIQPSMRTRETAVSFGNQGMLQDIMSHVRAIDDENRLYLYLSDSYKIHRGVIHDIAEDFNLNPFDPSQLPGDDYISTQSTGISSATKCVFVLDSQDYNGIILLGIAAALQKKTVLLRMENVSMWKGEFGRIAESSLEQDMQKQVRRFLKKYLNS